MKQAWRTVFRFAAAGTLVGLLIAPLMVLFSRDSTEAALIFLIRMSPSVWIGHDAISTWFDAITYAVLFSMAGLLLVYLRRKVKAGQPTQ
jgi:hypothetical protein